MKGCGQVAESCRRVLEIEVPPEIVQKRVQAVARRLQQRARLPGFRPGKAPLALIQQRFQEDIRSQVLGELVPEYVAARVKEQNWEPVGSPAVSDIHYGEEAPLRFKATLEILPEFELQDYKSLRVEVPEPQVSGEEVEKTLEQLREQAATYINREPRPLADGDFASISIQGVSSEKVSSPVHVDEVLCEIGGPNTVREFSENLRGAGVGEEREFAVAYPSDFKDPRLAGKTLSYRVNVLGIKQKQLPELDDDFARQVGEFSSLEALRQHVKEDLRRAKLQEDEQNARSQLRQRLVEMHDFPVPEALVERQVERRLERLRRQIAAQEAIPQNWSPDWGPIRASQREAAAEDVKSTFILEKIAYQETVEVDEEDLEKEIQKIAAATRQSVDFIRSRLTSEGGLDKIKSRLRIEKALDFVFHNARKLE